MDPLEAYETGLLNLGAEFDLEARGWAGEVKADFIFNTEDDSCYHLFNFATPREVKAAWVERNYHLPLDVFEAL